MAVGLIETVVTATGKPARVTATEKAIGDFDNFPRGNYEDFDFGGHCHRLDRMSQRPDAIAPVDIPVSAYSNLDCAGLARELALE